MAIVLGSVLALALAVASPDPAPLAGDPGPAAADPEPAALPAWLAATQGSLLRGAGMTTELSPRKITALYFDNHDLAELPSLIRFRDQHQDDVQFIMIDVGDDGGKPADLHAPVIAGDRVAIRRLKSLAGVDDGTPHLVFLDWEGHLLARNGLPLLADTAMAITIGDGDPPSRAQWFRIMDVGKGRLALTPREQAAELERRFGSCEAWPVYKQAIDGVPNKKDFLALGARIGATGHLDALLELIRMNNFGMTLDNDYCGRFNCCNLIDACAQEAGRSIVDIKASLDILASWTSSREDRVDGPTLFLLAALLARHDDDHLRALFWNGLNSFWDTTTAMVMISPLIAVDDQRAYDFLRKATADAKGTADFVAVEALRSALSDKRPQAIAFYEELLRNRPEIQTYLKIDR